MAIHAKSNRPSVDSFMNEFRRSWTSLCLPALTALPTSLPVVLYYLRVLWQCQCQCQRQFQPPSLSRGSSQCSAKQTNCQMVKRWRYNNKSYVQQHYIRNYIQLASKISRPDKFLNKLADVYENKKRDPCRSNYIVFPFLWDCLHITPHNSY